MNHKKLTIAYHEASHAVMALFLRVKVQIISIREMDSPRGTGKYRGFMKLDRTDRKIINPIHEVMIALAGGIGEGLFSDNVAKLAEDDLARASEEVEKMLMLSEKFRDKVAGLPVPDPDNLRTIKNPLVRACIANIADECFEIIIPLKPIIQFIAVELSKREELTGDEVSAFFNSFTQSGIGMTQPSAPHLPQLSTNVRNH